MIGELRELQQNLQQDLDRLRAALPPIFTKHEEVMARVENPLFVLKPVPPSYPDHPELDPPLALSAPEPVCIDCEWDEATGALTLVGVGNECWVGQWRWQELDDYRRLEARDALTEMVKRVPVIYHNAAADILKLRANHFANLNGEAFSVELHTRLEDTMLAHAVLHSEEEHTLLYLTMRYGKLPPYKHLKTFAPSEYNAGDVVEPVLIWKHAIEPELKADPQAEAVYRAQSLAFLPQQIEGEEAGIRVDAARPYQLRDKFAARIEQATLLAHATAGYSLNLNSPDQLKHYLYNVEDLPVQRNRDESATTDKDALAALRRSFGTEWDEEEEPTLDRAWENVEAGGHLMLEARYLFYGAQQSLSHYVMPCFQVEGEGDKRKIIGVRDRIYPECRIHVQSSGRHSYVGPALSQFKGEVELLLTPDVGYCWVGHDWSNIETWLLGAIANDPLILMAKALNWDTHTVNFCDVTGTPYPPKLTKAIHTCPCADCSAWRREFKWQGDEDLRRTFSKRFVYRLHYRGRAENAGDIPGARALGFNVDRLTQASELYLAKHLPIVEYWSRVDRQADEEGLIRTFMGRPRRLTSPYRNARNREAANHGMQGGVADIYITTALLVKAAAPWARLVYGKFDSQWWQVPNERRLEFMALYAPIVQREFNVQGRAISFPASFKLREAA